MIIPADYCQANWKFTGAAMPNGAEFTMGLSIDGVFAGPEDIAAVCIAAWVDNFINYQSSDITFSSVLVKNGPNDTGPFAEVASGVDGGNAGVALEPQVSVLVKKVTGSGGRANRGRFNIPGCLDSATNIGGALQSAVLTDMQADIALFFSDLQSADLNPVVLHSAGSPVSTPTPITSLQIAQQVATQRRRNRR